MTLSADSILKPMIVAAKVAFADSLEQVECYTVPEFEKIATTIVDIEANVAEHHYPRGRGPDAAHADASDSGHYRVDNRPDSIAG